MRTRRPSLIACVVLIGLAQAPASAQDRSPPAPPSPPEAAPAGEEVGRAPGEPDRFEAILKRAQVGFDEAAAAGLPPGSHPRVLTLKDAYTLALILARTPEGRRDRIAALDPNDLAGRAEKAGVADFARFRRDFLAGGDDRDGFRDPSAAYLDLLARLQEVASGQRLVLALEVNLAVTKEFARGPASGLNQAQLDQIDTRLAKARLEWNEALGQYRDDLDALKARLGLPPSAAVVPDRATLAAFHTAFDGLEHWSADAERTPKALDALVATLPSPADVTIDGRSALEVFIGRPDHLADLLRSAATVATKARGGEDDRRELRLRRSIRRLGTVAESYRIGQTRLPLACRRKVALLEQLLAPPTMAELNDPGSASTRRTVDVADIIDGQAAVLRIEDQLVRAWVESQALRLAIYRDLGTLPFDDWDSFLGSFRPEARALPTPPEGPGAELPAPGEPKPAARAPAPEDRPPPPPPGRP